MRRSYLLHCHGPNHKVDGCFNSNNEAAQYKVFVAIQVGDNAKDSGILILVPTNI